LVSEPNGGKKLTSYLILDADGVLIDSDHACHLCHMHLDPGLTYEQAVEHHIEYFMETRHCKEKGQLSPDEAQRKEAFAHFVYSHGKNFHEFIDELRKLKNTKMSVVSSGKSRYLKKFLNPDVTGLNFDQVYGFDYHHSKEKKVIDACEFWGVDTKDVRYLTDTRSDVIELAGFLPIENILGVTWGTHSFEILSSLLEERQILTGFVDIHRFFS